MLKLELKRIFSKKLNVLAVGLMVILAAVFSGFAATSNRYVDAHGAVSTGMLATRKLAENKQGYAGTLREAELTKIVAQYKAVMAQSQDEQDANYGTLYQPIDDILNFMISVLTPDAGYDETVLDSVTEDSVQDFYTWYQSNMKWMADQYGKTPAQKDYLEKKYSEITLPIQYESYGAWDTMIMYARIRLCWRFWLDLSVPGYLQMIFRQRRMRYFLLRSMEDPKQLKLRYWQALLRQR